MIETYPDRERRPQRDGLHPVGTESTEDRSIAVVGDAEHVPVAGGAGTHSMALFSVGETRSVTKPIARGG